MDICEFMLLGSSPHSRGTPDGVLNRVDSVGIIPAFAGNTKKREKDGFGAWDHPRIRGEHESRRLFQMGFLGSSPHSRGTRNVAVSLDLDRGIIPAFAGNTRLPANIPPHQEDHPRIRGEHGPWSIVMETRAGSSPHSRGTHKLVGTIPAADRIIPAFAGNTSRSR